MVVYVKRFLHRGCRIARSGAESDFAEALQYPERNTISDMNMIVSCFTAGGTPELERFESVWGLFVNLSANRFIEVHRLSGEPGRPANDGFQGAGGAGLARFRRSVARLPVG
jgi:hypothetical protein